MRRAGTTVFVHHSAVSREERELAEERFHRGTDACIVCTSTLELGIDVGDLDRVLQAEAPDTVGSFLQRMGRTGRAPVRWRTRPSSARPPRECSRPSRSSSSRVRAGSRTSRSSDRCWPVLIHQLLAMSLASDGVAAQPAWEQLSRVPDFRGIGRDEFDRLLDWMVRDGSLVLAGGRLVLGPKAERRFGRRNFMELFAVFSSPQSYTVQTRRRPAARLAQPGVRRPARRRRELLPPGRQALGRNRGPARRPARRRRAGPARAAADLGRISSRSFWARPSAAGSARSSRRMSLTAT